MEKNLSIFTDGGSRGNPGPAAIGFVVQDKQGKILFKKGKAIGRATNNVAEYTAVIEALTWLVQQKDFDKVDFFLDSKLAVNQLNGLYKIKDAKLRDLIIKVRILERSVSTKINYAFVPREKNKQADQMVNFALNKKP